MPKTIERRALEWLNSGDVCEAAEAMVCAALGMKGRSEYPLDFADLNRCLVAARRVGLDDSHLSRVAKLSPQWRAIVDNWHVLRRLMSRDQLVTVQSRMGAIGVWH